MKLTCAVMAGLGFLVAGCGPDEEPAVSPSLGQLEATQTAQTAAVPAGDIGALLNARRAENGLAPLTSSAQLTAAARIHAQDMASNGFFSHTGSDNSSVGDRVRAQGYGFCFVAENIAQGQRSAAETMQSWMNSPGHRRNNLSPKSSEYGAARGAGNTWVLVFGRSGC